MGLAAHTEGVQRLLASYRAIPPNAAVRLAKSTSNLFRTRVHHRTPGLDTSGLTNVIGVDPVTRTADVSGMCSYEKLVAATLPYGLAPLVVPQLKTITVGGAVTGLGIESTSFRHGLPHESVLEMDILTGSGDVVRATRDEHGDLFRAFPNSYGTLGYAVRLRIELEQVRPFVELHHLRCHTLAEMVAVLREISETRSYAGAAVHYVDGVVFSAQESYVCIGVQTGAAGAVSDYTGADIYYRSLRHQDGVRSDRLTIHDYLWRWDTDWFWCSRAFGAQNPKVRRFWPRRWRRSSVYWKLVGYDQKYRIADRIEAYHGRPARERVVQDVEVPMERVEEFVAWFLDQVPIEPLWLCPLRLREDTPWPLYPLQSNRSYVNIGFWSSVPIDPTRDNYASYTNRLIEKKVSELDGHKSLYSDSFYTREEFNALYGGLEYDTVKKIYDPDSRLLDLYAKAVGNL